MEQIEIKMGLSGASEVHLYITEGCGKSIAHKIILWTFFSYLLEATVVYESKIWSIDLSSSTTSVI